MLINDKIWRLEPANIEDGAALVDDAQLSAPRDFVDKLAVNDGIVVASWDEARLCGRVHALGVVVKLVKESSVATVDWRRANFTVTPSPQGAIQWTARAFFKFAPGPSAKYRLAEYFRDAFYGTAQPTQAAPPGAPQLAGKSAKPPAVTVTTASLSPQLNRVAPNGELIATKARGTFMGNRADRVRWLVCELDFPRDLKTPRKYTKLFFLDEAVALSAGQRPCQTCRRDRYQDYVAAVRKDFEIDGATALDKHLSQARSAPSLRAPVQSLPDGAFVDLGEGDFRIVWQGALHRWTPEGYLDPVPMKSAGSGEASLLTPGPSLAALRNGYRPVMHPTIANTGH